MEYKNYKIESILGRLGGYEVEIYLEDDLIKKQSGFAFEADTKVFAQGYIDGLHDRLQLNKEYSERLTNTKDCIEEILK